MIGIIFWVINNASTKSEIILNHELSLDKKDCMMKISFINVGIMIVLN